MKNKKGFTLVELIVVIAILGILSLFLVPSFMGYAEDAKEQVAKSNTRTVWSAANAVLASGKYDPINDDLNELVKAKLGDSFTGDIDVVLVDNILHDVSYTSNGYYCEFVIGSDIQCVPDTSD